MTPTAERADDRPETEVERLRAETRALRAELVACHRHRREAEAEVERLRREMARCRERIAALEGGIGST